jgi:hypothetical protein
LYRYAEATGRAKAGWSVVKKKGVQANRVFGAMGGKAACSVA